MSDPGYYFLPGDYARDTAHLTNDEDLAYRRLLDLYYSRGLPLPESIERLQTIARVPLQAVQNVADEFFPVNGDGTRHNKRADREIKKRADWVAEQSRKGKLSGEARKIKAMNPGSTPVQPKPEPKANRTPTEGEPPYPLPSPLPIPPITTDAEHKGSAVVPEDVPEDMPEEFKEFYQAYPIHKSKKDALKVWKRLGKSRPPLNILLDAIAKQKNGRRWKEGFIMNPARWLRGGCWDDEPEPELIPRDAFPPMRN